MKRIFNLLIIVMASIASLGINAQDASLRDERLGAYQQAYDQGQLRTSPWQLRPARLYTPGEEESMAQAFPTPYQTYNIPSVQDNALRNERLNAYYDAYHQGQLRAPWERRDMRAQRHYSPEIEQDLAVAYGVPGFERLVTPADYYQRLRQERLGAYQQAYNQGAFRLSPWQRFRWWADKNFYITSAKQKISDLFNAASYYKGLAADQAWELYNYGLTNYNNLSGQAKEKFNTWWYATNNPEQGQQGILDQVRAQWDFVTQYLSDITSSAYSAARSYLQPQPYQLSVEEQSAWDEYFDAVNKIDDEEQQLPGVRETWNRMITERKYPSELNREINERKQQIAEKRTQAKVILDQKLQEIKKRKQLQQEAE